MSALTSRLSEHPSQRIDRSRKVTILFEGRRIEACEGDAIASALYASGIRIFSRSFKYHRPRGLFCVNGRCPNCLMNVNGRPNVRTCVEPVADGMQIRHQNAYPSLDHDLLSIVDKLDRFLPVGFYYKTFIHPRWMWPVYEWVLRHLAGLGKVDTDRIADVEYEKVYRSADVAIIGGGPAGLSAAIAASRLGADVVLIDDQPEPGGHLRIDGRVYTDTDIEDYSGLRGFEIGRRLVETLREERKVKILTGATAFGWYEGDLLGIVRGNRMTQLRAKRVVVATGRRDRTLVFRNNDLPGVFLRSGIQRLLHLYGVLPGRRAIVISAHYEGLSVACDLLDAGAHVEAVVETESDFPEDHDEVQQLRGRDVPLLSSSIIVEARGRRHVTGAVIAHLDEVGRPVPGSEYTVPCDLVVLAVGAEPEAALLFQSGCRMDYDETGSEVIPRRMIPTLHPSGDLIGVHDLRAILLDGKVAGMTAASEAGLGVDITLLHRYRREFESLRDGGSFARMSPIVVPHPCGGKKMFVCLCEDVTEKDLCDAVEEGFDGIETLKRYSTNSMGPCQGKVCSIPAIAICARETGRGIPEVGATTTRPPFIPVPLGVLAGPRHHPVKLTPTHERHLALDARMMDMGEWKRPHTYTTTTEEYRAVRERVGLIDVGTLGKLDVRGKDAGILLDKVYTGILSTLRVGRIRYGLMCDDAGIILDDGTVTRLATDRFFITTTTGNIEFVEQWLTWWAAGTGMCVHVTNVTAGFAAVNLAGPRARDVLRKVTGIDLSSSACPYMAAARGDVAGIPALLLRIGFVGEVGYEMHVPAEYGIALWNALMDAGHEFGIAPFGVETQRLLRLEKRHVIVGQDTDALSNPLEADMAWAVKLEKPDFIGRHALIQVQERGLRNKLVGFRMRDGVVPEEGCAVAVNGTPVGRVTSARFSPHVGRGIGMAWVPAGMAVIGTEVPIRVDGRTVIGEVVEGAFYDPEGKRLRE
jgi:sarcosine oxidase subunit alpha